MKVQYVSRAIPVNTAEGHPNIRWMSQDQFFTGIFVMHPSTGNAYRLSVEGCHKGTWARVIGPPFAFAAIKSVIQEWGCARESCDFLTIQERLNDMWTGDYQKQKPQLELA